MPSLTGEGLGGMQSLEKDVYASMERPEVAALVPQGARHVLDVGCGAGTLGRALKQRDPDVQVTGVEMSPALADRAAPRLDRVVVGTVEESLSELPDGAYDCIVAADVLEHMINPFQLLRDVRPKLTRDGVIVASIPNVRHWSVLRELVLHGRWQYAERGLLDSGHLRFFTESGIVAMFVWAGYRPRVADVVGAAPRPLWWANRVVGGRLMPCIAYQYLVVAEPEWDRPAVAEPWWAGGRAL